MKKRQILSKSQGNQLKNISVRQWLDFYLTIPCKPEIFTFLPAILDVSFT
jgi:hypothetical protein